MHSCFELKSVPNRHICFVGYPRMLNVRCGGIMVKVIEAEKETWLNLYRYQ